MINFKSVLFLYVVIGIIIILDEMNRHKNESYDYSSHIKSSTFYQVISTCGRWLYAILPSEKSIVIIERKSGELVKTIALPFVPKSIRLQPATNQISIISVDGPMSGKLTLELRELNLIY
jgi:hypothetical protein